MIASEAPRPVVLNVAITGHRATALTARLVRALRPLVYTLFRELRLAALRLQQADPRLCSQTAPKLCLYTPLATGADQIAAICARSSGYFVRALLPFEAHEYRMDFEDRDELAMFEQALLAADEVVALPGSRSDVETAYLQVGESLVEAADVLIAIWDGAPARGAGGTANVVSLALRHSKPVIHIQIDPASDEVRMRTLIDGDQAAGFDASVHDPVLYRRLLTSALDLKAISVVPDGRKDRVTAD